MCMNIYCSIDCHSIYNIRINVNRIKLAFSQVVQVKKGESF